MKPTITAFERSPDRGRGLARDMRVRWALEEVGLPYDVRLVSFQEMKQPAHLALHPFGQIPTYQEGELVLFESGAILLHVGERHAGLLPGDADWLSNVASSPVLTRYSKSPDHAYSPALRAQVLQQARGEHRTEIAKGLRWLARLAENEPLVAEVLRAGP